MKQFILQPLDELLNNENFVSRVRELEAQAGAKPSAKVVSLGEMGQQTGVLIVDQLIIPDYVTGNYLAVLNNDGAVVDAALGAAGPTNAYKFSYNTNSIPNFGGMYAYVNASDYVIILQVDGSTSGDADAVGSVYVNAYGGSNQGGLIYLHAYDPTSAIYTGIRLNGGIGLITINDGTNDVDTRISGDVDINALYVDASADSVGIGTLTPSTPLHVYESSAVTNALVSVLRADINSSGTVGNGLGVRIDMGIEDSAGNTDVAGYIGTEWLDKTSASEEAQFDIGIETAGALVKAAYLNRWGMYNKYAYMSHEMTTQYINDWMSLTAGINGWDTAVIGAGTVALIADVANHHGIARTTQSGANTGCANYISTVGNYLITGNDAFGACFRTQTGTTDCEFRFGFNDTVGSATVDPVDGAYIHIEGVRLEGKTSNNSTRSTTGTTYTITTNTWYRMKILVNSAASTVNYYLYSAAGALLWTDSLSANIPTAAGREVGICINAYKTSAGTVNLIDVDWTAYWNEAVVTR